MKDYLKLFLLLFLFCGCIKNTEKEKVILQSTESNKQALFLLPVTKRGLEMDELEKRLSVDEIEKIAAVLVNEEGTSQEDVNKAVITLNRMKKHDYEKTYLLHLEKKLEYEERQEDYEDKEIVLGDYKRRIEYYKFLFKNAKDYKQSYARLSKDIQLELRKKAEEEMKEKYKHLLK